MKLLLLPAYFYPELVSDTPLDDARYKAFADSGIDMALITPSPTRNVSDRDKKKYSAIHSEEMYNGMMKVHRFNMIDEGKNPIGRAFRYFLCFIKQYWLGIKEINVDVIFVVSTPPIQGMLAALIKRKMNCKFIYNLQDIFPDTLVGAGLAKKNGLLWKIGRKIENYTYKHADKIIVISQDFKRNIIEKGVPKNKIEVVYNWVDQDSIHPIDDMENPLFDEFNISKDKFRIVYAGNLGHAQNLDIVIRAAEILRNNHQIEFLIFGKGGIEDDLKKNIKEKKLENVRVLPLQPYERVSYVYSLGNACLVSCKAGLGGSALPSKTWSILSTGRPVIASFDEGELKEILETNNMGLFTQADNVVDFVSGIITLATNTQKSIQMGKNGREFILSNLSKEVAVAKYVNIVKDVCKA